MKQPNCPYCKMEVDLELDEPGQWCDDEHCPDGEFEKICDYCDKEMLITVNWKPFFGAEESE